MKDLRKHRSCKPVILKRVDTGELVEITNLFHYCQEKDLSYTGIKNLFYDLPSENHLTCQGYCLPETDLEKVRLSKLTNKWKKIWDTEITLENYYTGDVVTLVGGESIDFCEKNGFKPRVVWSLYSGTMKQCKGWFKKGSEVNIRKKLHIEPVRLITPEGDTIEVANVCHWVRNVFAKNLDSKEAHKKYRSFHKLIRGETKKAYGYVLKS